MNGRFLEIVSQRLARRALAICIVFIFTALVHAERPIVLTVDVSQTPQRIYHVHELLPVSPGPLRLVYPKWIQGEHGPTGPIMNVAGFHLFADGKSVAWRRDVRDMYAIECQIPRGVPEVTIEFDYMPGDENAPFTGGTETTNQLGVLYWSQVVYYPGNRNARSIQVQPALRVPAGWSVGGALLRDDHGPADGAIHFAAINLADLTDTPIPFGHFFKSIPLVSDGGVPVVMDVFADSERALELPKERIEQYNRLVREMRSFLGGGHFDRYHVLVSQSDHLNYFGVEHHRCCDIRLGEKGMTSDDHHKQHGEIIPHEFFHSWNGKAFRPEGMTARNLQENLDTNMLWIYEGLTSYYGKVLAARCGIWSQEEAREVFAKTVARLYATPGRTWRSLEDVCVAAQIIYPAPKSWSKWRRSADFYPEGTTLWLEVDIQIRKLTNGSKSLDDFCSLFLRANQSGKLMEIPYREKDVYNALAKVAPYDWKTFFAERLNSTKPPAADAGVVNGGWSVEYSDKPNKAFESPDGGPSDLTYSLGMTVAKDGTIADVSPTMAAYKAGLSPGMHIVAVNNRKFTPELLTNTLKESATSSQSLTLLIENYDYFSTHTIDYRGGVRQPHLVRDASKPDLLSAVLAPRVTQ